MLKIALTGGIGTGKTHVATRLVSAGIPLVDADAVARALVAPGQPLLQTIVERFGRDVLTPEGALDRARLGDRVFRDPAARQDLEAILHPAIRQTIGGFFDTLPPGTPMAAADIPLLFETGREAEFDRIIVAACEPETQIARVMARDGLSRADVERRLSAQWPIAEKVRRADYVIRTDGTYADTNAEVDRVLERLRAELEAGGD